MMTLSLTFISSVRHHSAALSRATASAAPQSVYEHLATPVTARGESAGPVTAFVAEVRRMFRQPACVQGVFGPADERLAAEWHRAGVSLETVRRAILLGSARKSLSMLDRPGSEPVQSLRYFERLVEAVRNQSWSATYWEHVELTLERCERTWRQQPGPA